MMAKVEEEVKMQAKMTEESCPNSSKCTLNEERKQEIVERKAEIGTAGSKE